MNRLERGLLTLTERQTPNVRNSTASGGIFSPVSASPEQFSSADAAMKLSGMA